MSDRLNDSYAVVVIGGGAAGLSGALTLARARRSVAVLDGGQPRNAPASGVHGLLGLDGIDPAELLARGRAEVRRYGGHVVSAEVVSTAREDGQFVVGLVDGRTVRASRLLVATGLTDEIPDIPGLRQRWGRDVVHCPYCHGWEFRDRALGVLATGPRSVHQALLFRQWTSDVLFFSHDSDVTEEQAEQLTARGVRVVPGNVTAVEVADDRLTGLRLADGGVVARDAVAVGSRMVARTEFLAGLGLRPVPHPMGEHLAADQTGRTDVPGVWVAGNITDLAAQVSVAASAGAWAAAQINADLVDAETANAVAELREPFSATSEARVAELVLGNRRHGV